MFVRGEPVVDLWGGVADAATGRRWAEDTTAMVFSATKGVTAVLIHLLAQRRMLDLDAPVARYWPEFAAEGKAQASVRQLLSHRVGLPTLDRPVTPADLAAWDPVVDRLAAQAPLWRPGTRHGYHPITWGWLVGTVIRRVTSRSVGSVLADEVSTPLSLDLWIGLPETAESRVATLESVPATLTEDTAVESDENPPTSDVNESTSLLVRAMILCEPALDMNSRALRAVELPSYNGVMTARSLAAIYAATVSEVNGVRLLDPTTLDGAIRDQSNGRDAVLGATTRFASGFMLPTSTEPLMGPNSSGHPGAGGSLGFADTAAQVGFGYVMNRLHSDPSNDRRAARLVDAVARNLR